MGTNPTPKNPMGNKVSLASPIRDQHTVPASQSNLPFDEQLFNDQIN